MESSRAIKPVSKGRYLNLRSQSNRVRCTDPQSYLEYEDSLEPSVRYVDSLKVVRSLDRERTQLRRLGDKTRQEQD